MPNEQEQARLVETFARQGVEYMLIGQGAAILQDYWGTTQDIDVYPRKSGENCRRLVNALRELGFSIDARQEAETSKQVVEFLVNLFQVSDPWKVSDNGTPRGATVTVRKIPERQSIEHFKSRWRGHSAYA